MADAHSTEPDDDSADPLGDNAPPGDFHDGGDDEEEEILPMSSILGLSVESAGVKIEVTADGLNAAENIAELVALALETASKLRTEIQ